MKNGFGKYCWSDGSNYEGQWIKNIITGNGDYHWPDGRAYSG